MSLTRAAQRYLDVPSPGAPPRGSGLAIQTGGTATNQGANTTRVLTQAFGNTNQTLTPWSLYRGQPGGASFLSNTTRAAQLVADCNGPRTIVCSFTAVEAATVVTAGVPFSVPTERQEVQQEGIPYTRLQGVIAWSTGTGTDAYVVLDLNAGCVFRVFGMQATCWVLMYPQETISGAFTPFSRVIAHKEPPINAVPNTRIFSTVVQSSVQTAEVRSEGFPGAWQCTGVIVRDQLDQQVYVPPFARRVRITQSPLGSPFTLAVFRDRFGNAVGTVSQVPGTRESLLTSVPSNAVTLEVPSTAIFGDVSAVFEVSQF